MIRDALVEYDHGNWGEARLLFKRAHELLPNARTWRALGMTSFEQKRYVDAITELQAALDNDVKPLTVDQRQTTVRLLARARDYTAHYGLKVPTGIEEISVDDRVVHLPDDGVLLLDPGAHSLRVQLLDGEDIERQVIATVGARETLVFEASEVAATKPGAVTNVTQLSIDDGPAYEERSDNGRLWTWIAAGTTGMFAAGAVSFWVVAAATHSDFKALQNACPACDAQDFAATRRAGQRYTTLAQVSTALAGVAAAATIVIYLAESGPSERRSHVKLGIGPGTVFLAASL